MIEEKKKMIMKIPIFETKKKNILGLHSASIFLEGKLVKRVFSFVFSGCKYTYGMC